MDKFPRWALWASIGAIAGLLGGYCISLFSGTARGFGRRNLDFFDWIAWDFAETALWLGVGAVAGVLLSAAIKAR